MNFDPKSPTSYEYIHYTGGNIEEIDLNRAYTQYTGKLAYNTSNGLWLSIAGIHDWERYCLENNCRLDTLQREFQILLKPQAKILIIHNKTAFEGFIKEYGNYRKDYFDLSIRWDKIINNYQGVAMPCLFPELMNMFRWYKTWCCTSACIWDLQAVEKAEKQ